MSEFEGTLLSWGNLWESVERDACMEGFLKCPNCKKTKEVKMIWKPEIKKAVCPECGWHRLKKD
jgi:Zn ribbon nucleic-acid-binding protein